MMDEKSSLSCGSAHRIAGGGAERLISVILRTGVFASMAVIAIGGVITLLRHSEGSISAKELSALRGAVGAFPYTLSGKLPGACACCTGRHSSASDCSSLS